MELDYTEIGKRIALRRKQLGLKQSQVSEKAEIGEKYLSCIERATSIPSLEVLMRIARALDTTPNHLLLGSSHLGQESWQDVAELLRGLDPKQLDLAKSFLLWLSAQSIS
ncbi:MAG: helix-turn-helix transcriptional regulator [Oscillospiraceae bacterium]|nr:helix-turn-helix transcriptional regulator [Oscillospiraceae bacterium]